MCNCTYIGETKGNEPLISHNTNVFKGVMQQKHNGKCKNYIIMRHNDNKYINVKKKCDLISK